MKTLRIKYFAQLRDERGTAEEERQTVSESVADLYAELRAEFKFSLPSESVRAAVNGDYAGWNTVLKDRDEVVFIPPVAGG